MAILNIQEISEGGIYEPAEGSNRVVVFAGSGESAYTSRPIVGLSFGAASCVEAIYQGVTVKPKAGIWYVKEADIPAGANTLTVDWGGEIHDAFKGVAYTITDIDQAGPVGASNKLFTSSSASGIDLPITTTDNSILIAVGATNSQLTGVIYSSTQAASTLTLTHDGDFTEPSFSVDILSSEIVTGSSNTVGFRALGTSVELVGVAATFNNISPSASIGTDNEIDQFERDVALVPAFENSLTKCLINGVDHTGLLQAGDTQLKYIKRVFDAAGSDTCDVVIGDGVDTDVTIPSVTVNTTHPYPVPNEPVDSNSMFSGVTVSGDNAAFRITSAPTKGTLDLSDPAKYLHDVDASKGGVYTPNAGATGTDSFTFEVHDPDEPVALNRTQSGTVTINIVEGEVVPEPWDNISYALRSYVRKVVFHSKLIIATRGRAEETIIHDAMVALGGTSMTPPSDGILPEPGWTGTQTVSEFEKRIDKLPTVQEAEVIADITAHLTLLGWT